MKIRFTFKSPDVVQDTVREAVEDSVREDESVSADGKDDEVELQYEDVMAIASKWFRYGEYVTVELDTEANTCQVVPPKY